LTLKAEEWSSPIVTPPGGTAHDNYIYFASEHTMNGVHEKQWLAIANGRTDAGSTHCSLHNVHSLSQWFIVMSFGGAREQWQVWVGKSVALCVGRWEMEVLVQIAGGFSATPVSGQPGRR
jgi:hypothetical protein